jgi:hypothetical protein
MAKVKKRTASTPGRKPSPLSYSLLLPIRVNRPMMDALEAAGKRAGTGPHGEARARLVNEMLRTKEIRKQDLPE